MKLRHDLLLCKRYQKPERFGSIILPDFYRVDGTFTLWEFQEAGTWKPGDRAIKEWREYLPVEGLPVGTILRTRPFVGILVPGSTRDEYFGLWMVPAKDVDYVETY